MTRRTAYALLEYVLSLIGTIGFIFVVSVMWWKYNYPDPTTPTTDAVYLCWGLLGWMLAFCWAYTDVRPMAPEGE